MFTLKENHNSELMTHVFLDTNIFLHFKEISQIDWLKELDVKKCTLLITLIVVKELDKYKADSSPKGTRAKKALKKIESYDLAEVEIRNGVYAKIYVHEPVSEVYNRHQLERSVADHQLLASILDFKEQTKSTVKFYSYDSALRVQARFKGIEVIEPNEKYQLPLADPREKEIKKLKQSIVDLTSKSPKVQLTFSNNTELQEFSIKNEENYNEWSLAKISNLVFEYPKFEKNAYFYAIPDYMKPLDSQIHNYNQKVDAYYSKYEEQLPSLYDYENECLLFFKIELCIANSGRIPANHIDIRVFSFEGDEVEIFDEESLPKKPSLPSPPRLPKYSPLFHNLEHVIVDEPPINILATLRKPSINLKDLNYTIDKNKTLITFYRTKLKHDDNDVLEPFYLKFSNREAIKNVKLKFEIRVDNIVETTIGTLNIKFNLPTRQYPYH